MESPVPAYQGAESSIFVRYAHADNEIVFPQLLWLHDQGFNIWFDEGIAAGSDWTNSLAERIARAALFLFFVTPPSLDSDHYPRAVTWRTPNCLLVWICRSVRPRR